MVDHADHAYGNSVFTDAGATVICSEDCTAESKERNPRSWASDKGTGEFSLKPFRLEHPQVGFRDSMAIDDGTRRVELVRVGPAHTRGDAVAYLPRERILFTGDLVVTRPGNFVGDASVDPDGWVRTLDALSARDVRVLVSGHGPQGTAAAIRGNREYLADMIKQIRAGIARGASVDELEKGIDLKAHNPWGQDDARNRTSIRAWYEKLKTR
jgi:glyoxylase-like metal-dependent hydrolase (beta-lactamase superfamily II)